MDADGANQTRITDDLDGLWGGVSWGPEPVPATPVTNPKAGYYFTRGLQPFDEAKVREAAFLVIDELAIWEEFSYFPNGDHNVDSQLPFDHGAIRGLDIERAKQLMAEAGFPDGFDAGCIFSAGEVPQVVPGAIAAAMYTHIGIGCGADSGPRLVVTDDVIGNRSSP